MDGAVREEARETAPACVEQTFLAVHVQEGLLLARETRRGQVFGCGRRTHCEADVFAVLLLKSAVAFDDLGGEVVRKTCSVNDFAGQLRAPSEVPDVTRIKVVKSFVQ